MGDSDSESLLKLCIWQCSSAQLESVPSREHNISILVLELDMRELEKGRKSAAQKRGSFVSGIFNIGERAFLGIAIGLANRFDREMVAQYLRKIKVYIYSNQGR